MHIKRFKYINCWNLKRISLILSRPTLHKNIYDLTTYFLILLLLLNNKNEKIFLSLQSQRDTRKLLGPEQTILSCFFSVWLGVRMWSCKGVLTFIYHFILKLLYWICLILLYNTYTRLDIVTVSICFFVYCLLSSPQTYVA